MAKIKKEQLEKVVKQQEVLKDHLVAIGGLESQKHALLHKLADLNEEVEQTKKELEEEYGAVNIDLKDGTYTEIEKKDAE
jgi:hypothetical protein|tara:strand:- start:281 stop:520 length:240 start_codon:yes stop_codon:yes gene_type:complete